MSRKRAKSRQDDEAFAGEEEFKFVRSFHDIFLSIGLVMLLFGLYLASELLITMPNLLASNTPLQSASGHFLFRATVFGGLAGVCWILAEIFTRARRQTLPSIVLFSGYSWFLFFAAAVAYLGVRVNVESFGEIIDAMADSRDFPLFMSIVLTVSSLIFYARMKLPFAMGGAGVGIASFVFSLFIYRQGWGLNESDGAFSPTFLTLWIWAGVVLFGLGLYFDALDPARRRRFSDNAFWLHLFAAPVLFTGIMEKFGGGTSPLLALIIVGGFAVVSLLINRRALLVSGILTAAYAISQLSGEAGLSGLWRTATTMIVLGGALVLLGGAWNGLRAVITAPFPNRGPLARIIPPNSPG